MSTQDPASAQTGLGMEGTRGEPDASLPERATAMEERRRIFTFFFPLFPKVPVNPKLAFLLFTMSSIIDRSYRSMILRFIFITVTKIIP